MAFGKKKEKAPTFYLNKEENGTSYVGNVGDDCPALVKFSPTGKAILETMGQTFWANPKENQYGTFFVFVIDGHFWFGNEGISKTSKGGKPPRPYFQLKQGAVAPPRENNAQAEGAAAAASLQPPFDGGTGPAGLAAPAGMSPGVQERPVTETRAAAFTGAPSTTSPRPPKPRGYNKPQGG